MVRKIAIGVVALVLLGVLVGAVLPRTWQVEQSVEINAPASRIHPLIIDFHRWQEWSVWTKALDPQVRNTFEGPGDGVGAKWSWLGPQMGRGQLEIVEADAAKGVVIDEAIESDSVNAHSSFTYTHLGGVTRVTWVDSGTLPPVLGGFFRGSVERELNRALREGLDALKAKVEADGPVATPR